LWLVSLASYVKLTTYRDVGGMPETPLVDIVNAFTGALLLPIYHLRGIRLDSCNPPFLFKLMPNNREILLITTTF
jgi:hypothetical protein